MNKEKLLIFDGNALVHRAFHALPTTMKTKKGEVVNAVFGFASVLIKTLKEFKPKYVVLTFDKKAPTFRHEMFKEYKAQRKKAPDELYSQIPIIKELVKTFNIPVFELAGFEADDLIGTISKKNKKTKNIVVSGDMDLLQLIDENTKIYKLGRGIGDGTLYDAQITKEKYGILPKQIVDYKALRGDSSDNIPGVPGIGEKTALELLSQFGSLENLYKKIDKNDKAIQNIKPRILKLLKDNKKQAFLSYELANIKTNAPIDFDLEKARFDNFDKEKIIKFLSEMEFRSLLNRVKEIFSLDKKDQGNIDKFARDKKEFKYYLIDNKKSFAEFFKKLKKQKEFTFDTETTSFDPLNSGLLGISFSFAEGEAYYVYINEREKQEQSFDLFNYQNKATPSKNSFLEKLKIVFEDERIKKIAHNIKFDYRVMKNAGVETKNLYFDTMIASYLFNPGTRQHNLDALTFSEFGFEKISKDDLLGTGRDKVSFGEVDLEKLYVYSCEDADWTNRIYKKLKKKLKKEKLDKLFFEMEMPLVLVLAQMEENGIMIDKDFLAKMSVKLHKKINQLEKKIHELAGEPFNVRSTKQLKEILFEKLKISSKGIKKNKTGFSTAFDELEKLKDEHKIIALIQEHRELSKLTSTYIDSLPKLTNKKTNRIHTSFNQTVTATGRLSSSDPNLQNIPIRTKLGKQIRQAFVAQKGNKLFSIDYSQIELRVAAHLSGDKKMIQAFKNGLDIHTQTAAEINHINIDEVSPEMRRSAKAVNFGVLYGQGIHGLAKGTGISYMEAKNFIEDYFATFPGIKKFIDQTIEKARKTGKVETMFGRVRYLPDINSTTPMIKKASERMAINTPVQGSAADILKMAMIKIFQTKNIQAKMLLQVHDELVFETRANKVQEEAKKIKKIMETIIKLKVPLVADVKVGNNWGEMEEIF